MTPVLKANKRQCSCLLFRNGRAALSVIDVPYARAVRREMKTLISEPHPFD